VAAVRGTPDEWNAAAFSATQFRDDGTDSRIQSSNALTTT
jgi:hypothetical protein